MSARRLARRTLLAGGVAALAAACLPREPSREPDGAWLEPDARFLVPFFRDLAEVEAGRAREPVRILMLGDSHTAGDRLSGRLRSLFQGRFGSGGRGMLPPGVPFQHFTPTDVEVSQSEGWEVANSLSRSATGPWGLSGFRITATRPEAFVQVSSTDPRGFDRVVLDYLAQPGGGSFSIAVDGQPQGLTLGGRTVAAVETADPRVEGRSLRIDVRRGSRSLLLQTQGDGPVGLLSWTVERTGPGVVLDSHGVVGATVGVIERWDPAIVRQQVAERRPSLLLMAYGTNEGFAAELDLDAYARSFERQVALLRQGAPGVPVVVIGPPDGTRMPRACFDLDWQPQDYSCRTLTPAEEAVYDQVFRTTGPVDPANCFWHPPPLLERVRETQRRLAIRNQLYWWDWERSMGGACSIHDWRLAEPPLAYPDHVHLRPAGYGRTGDALFAQITGQYDAWRGGRIAEAPGPAAG